MALGAEANRGARAHASSILSPAALIKRSFSRQAHLYILSLTLPCIWSGYGQYPMYPVAQPMAQQARMTLKYPDT